ncbi:hypothetical protein [Flavobacterium sp. FlaQc-50]|uniref:hypothetical protein n=1 Tax=unclassified Flavobacterium TaxID=196869 RepID=UPI0037579507
MELLKFSSVSIEAAFTKRYYNSLPLLMRLSKSERIFLDFVTEEMDDYNYISNSALTRNKFNGLLKKIGQDTYSETTIHRCFSNLAKHHLISKVKGRGLYQVSPVFFFRGSEEQRAKVLREILERINKEPINKLRHGLLSGIKPSSFQEPEVD